MKSIRCVSTRGSLVVAIVCCCSIAPAQQLIQDANPPLERVPRHAEHGPSHRSVNIEFTSHDGSAKLRGTLAFPRSREFPSVVVFVTDVTPPHMRRYDTFETPRRTLKHELLRRGLAVLSFDQRGAGRSSGDATGFTVGHLAQDLDAAVALLLARDDVDAESIGVVGISIGGLSAAIVAKQAKDFAFMVLVSPPATTGKEMVLRQMTRNARQAGVEIASMAAVRSYTNNLLDRIQRAQTTVGPELEKVPIAQGLNVDHPDVGRWRTATITLLNQLHSPWLRHFLKVDATRLLSEIPCPLLILYGADDAHYPGNANTLAAKRAIALNRKADQSVVVLPGLNHHLQRDETDHVTTDSPARMDASALLTIGKWVSLQMDSRTDGNAK